MIARTCKYCGVVFDSINGRQFSNHVRWCPSNTSNGDKGRSNLSKSKISYDNDKLGEPSRIVKRCLQCGNEFEITCRPKEVDSKNYCSIRCRNLIGAHSDRVWSDSMRENASNVTKELWKDAEYVQRILSNKKSLFTSRGEVEVRDYFMANFPDDEWTFGGCLRRDGEGIVRDLYSNKLKICIEYDGIWHFKDIHGQLRRKQYKDNLLEQWCIENNWRLIRIDENEYLKNKNALDVLTDLVYHGDDAITKIGNRYGVQSPDNTVR